MKQKFLMGNEAIGLGAVHAGVDLVCGYPGISYSFDYCDYGKSWIAYLKKGVDIE